jgi:hypothetical protein
VIRTLACGALSFIVLAMAGCGYFPEASFELVRESRLPRWFTIPPGFTRADVTVTMDYYIDSEGRTAKFRLLDVRNRPHERQGRPSGRKLAQMEGVLKGSQPISLDGNRDPGFEVITVNGITEVIEHRQMEPIFYITDDPAVLAKLGVAP